MDDVHDPRFVPFTIYHKRFLLWWGLGLFLCKLGSRRQLDYQLNTDGPFVLANLNRLAGTQQRTRPVNGTLNYFLRRSGHEPLADLRTRAVRRLIRMKALNDARLQGRYLILIDGTGFLRFHHEHCAYCLKQERGDTTLYMHQVLEAKLLGPGGLVISLATEFIDNRDLPDEASASDAAQRKQDCELKAYARLLPKLRADFPFLRICILGDAEFGCGTGFQLAKDHNASFIYGFKEGRLPTLWRDFQDLLPLCPEQRLECQTPAGTRQVYRWVEDLSYTDSQQRPWRLTAVRCEETEPEGKKHLWAWLVSEDLRVDREHVLAIAQEGGRQRWCIENQGFNTQKTSELNLEHAYGRKEQWQAYYYLLQIAHMLLQLVEKGSLLRRLAAEAGKTPLTLFGSLKNMAYRLRESLRFMHWPEEAFDVAAAGQIQIRLDSG